MSGEKKRVWERPHVTSVAIPEVEALLAESYKAQAQSWADAARRAREDAVSEGQGGEAETDGQSEQARTQIPFQSRAPAGGPHRGCRSSGTRV